MKVVLITCFLFFASLGTTSAQDPGWPRQIVKAQGTLVYYQPQVDDWENFQKLHWRMAISLTPAGAKEIVGVVTLHGDTSVNSETQMVLISNLQVDHTYFPSASPSDAASLDGVVRTFVPPSVWITMQRLVACVPKPSTPPAGVQLNNDPPKIFATYKPAILLSVEGNTMFGDVPKTKLQYVINTDWALFLYNKTTYYLLAGERWLDGAEPGRAVGSGGDAARRHEEVAEGAVVDWARQVHSSTAGERERADPRGLLQQHARRGVAV